MQKIETVIKIIRTLLKICFIILFVATLGLLISYWGLIAYAQWDLMYKMKPTLYLYAEAWILWLLGWAIVTLVRGIQNGSINLKKYLDFGIASKEEVIEKLGEATGKAVLEERGLVFWKFAFLWAMFGSVITIVLDHYFKIISVIETLLKLYFGVK